MAAQDTPVMQQHAAAKRAHPDCIVFFRLGDFYEMFGEDAVVGAALLDLTLTSRNRGKPDEIPMAGVPHHAAHAYIARLLERGHKVALCEQMADPKMVRGIVPREVVRVITPGTWTEGSEIPEKENNFLVALEPPGGQGGPGDFGLAVLDVSTAELRAVSVADLAEALGELSRLAPRELILGPALSETAADELRRALPGVVVRADLAEPDDALIDDIEGGRTFAEPVQGAVSRVVGYARRCFPRQSLPVFRVSSLQRSAYMELGLSAQSHLELVRSNSGNIATTLLGVLDKTQTACGGRLLRARLLNPLVEVSEIHARLSEVRTLFSDDSLRKQLRLLLDGVPDLERLSVRVMYGEATPRDLGAIRRGLGQAGAILELLGRQPALSTRLRVPRDLDVMPQLLALLERALVERPPALAKEGAVFRAGYDEELDRWASARLRGSGDFADIEARLREETGITNLKVKYTRVFGWYLEVTRAQAARVPKTWSRKQTVASGERYTTPELDELAAIMLESEDRFRERELELLRELAQEVRAKARVIHFLAHVLASLDVAAALAEVAREYDYVEPRVDQSDALELLEARHPVVERMQGLGRFVPNDADLGASGARVWLITGPNMAGKSTFLRQTALAVVMAQMGSFVAAKSAHIGVVDKVLSRLGASDNLALGESTFMVEMRETAYILRHATRASFVIIDEIGRGTSTFDGMSIAWAVLEYLADDVGCRTLFATHYQELTAMAQTSSLVGNYCVAASESEGSITFLHRVLPGAAARSYGVSVAELAGLPGRVVARARARLLDLEQGAGPAVEKDLGASDAEPLKPALEAPLRDARLVGILHELEDANLETWNGLKALEFVYSLRSALEVGPALRSAPGRGDAARFNRS